MSRTVKPTGSRQPDFRALEERLWYAREKAGLTQQELADVLGISKRTVQNYEAGVGYPRENRLLLWANACDFDYAWLAGDFYDAHPRTRAQAGGRASTATAQPTRHRKRDDSAGHTHRYVSSEREFEFSRNVTSDHMYARAA